MALKVIARPGRGKEGLTDEAGNSTNAADWSAVLAGLTTEFGKVAADNLRRDTGVREQQTLSNQPFNWKPWAMGAGVLVALVVVFKVAFK